MTVSILDIPDEIWVQIILHLNARERIALSNSSRIFYRLVFQEKHLLRELDFSGDRRLTSVSDIREYFDDTDISKHVQKVNLRNVNCVQPGPILNDSIGRAVNLVDIDMHGVMFTSVEQLASFLKPLVHLRSLCVNLPDTTGADFTGYDDLTESFERLRYLSVRLMYSNHEYSSDINFILRVCTQLEDLRIIRANMASGFIHRYISKICPKVLPNLKFVEFTGRRSYGVKDYLIRKVLPDPQKWTEFERGDVAVRESFTLVKDVRISEKIDRNEVMDSNSLNSVGELDTAVPSVLLSERLLDQVIRNICENVPEKFCALSRSTLTSTSMLKTAETQRLLENPSYPITYLYFDHDIEKDCDAHIVGSAFPSITKLHLFNIVKNRVSSPRPKNVEKRCENERLPFDYENRDQRSCFKMLVENTPNVRELTMSGRKISGNHIWDFDALHHMKNWKNLRTLRLHLIPTRDERDGRFLVEVGKHCKQLETMDFHIFGKSQATTCYMKNLSKMLTYCKNLKDFSIRQESVGQVSDVFNWFNHNTELRRICVLSRGETDDGIEIIASIERFLSKCSKLTTFLCRIDGLSSAVSRELSRIARRIRSELKRPRFPVQENDIRNSDEAWIFDSMNDDSSLCWYPRNRLTNYFWQNSHA